MSEKIVFGYWKVRGGGHIQRLLLAYTGAVWEDVKYQGHEQWFGKDKQELGFDFPNLPYIIEGDFKLTESRAIDQYVINRSDKKELLGKNIKDQAIVQQIIGVAKDAREPIGKLFWDKQWEKNKEESLKKAAPKLELLNKFYGDKDFALGYLTVVDFMIAQFSFYVQRISPEFYNKFPFLKRTRQAFEALPEIKKYYEQQTAVKDVFLPKEMSPLGLQLSDLKEQ